MKYGRLRVDSTALSANYSLFTEKARGEVGAVVKSDAYGLGVLPIVRHLLSVGCRSFFVATQSEARQIHSLVGDNLYVFEPPYTKHGFDELASLGAIPVVNSMAQLGYAARHPERAIAVHIDTGMERMGLPHGKLDVSKLKKLNIKLLMTHLACADDPDNDFNQVQVDRFCAISAQVPSLRTSIGNSAGTLTSHEFQGDLSRPGIGLYGANPFSKLENPLKIVARCEAQVLDIRHLEPGTTVGYGGTYKVERRTRLAVVGMGYADGIPHVLSNVGHLAYEGKFLPIRGRVSMDMTQVDATECEELKVGDWVEFFGDTIDVDDVAKSARSFGYEFLTGIGPRVERVYE